MAGMKSGQRATGLLVGVAALAVGVAAQPLGEQWEYQGSMEMAGATMAMPSVQRCEKPGGDDAPPMDKSCAISNRKTSGNSSSFDFHCGGSEPMDGHGTVSRSGNQLEARYVIMSDGAELTYVLTGKKLGSCPL